MNIENDCPAAREPLQADRTARQLEPKWLLSEDEAWRSFRSATIDDVRALAASGTFAFRVCAARDVAGRLMPNVLLVDEERQLIFEVPFQAFERLGRFCSNPEKALATVQQFHSEQGAVGGAA